MNSEVFKVKTEKILIYDINLHIVVTNNYNKFYKYLDENELFIDGDPYNSEASTFVGSNDDIVLILNYTDGIECSTIAHESIHIFNKILLLIKNSNIIELDERLAYMIEYLFTIVNEFCKSENLLKK